MALSQIPLEDIAEQHLRDLIDAGASESLYIEYKQETYGGTEGEHTEYLAAVSSFSNAAGGDLIIGMSSRRL